MEPISSFYIHWPFCPYRCHFCPFVAFQGQDHRMEQYHNALTTEIKQFMQGKDKLKLSTIYFGGGTPSTYPNNLLLDMFGTLENTCDLSELQEVTLEVNPGTVNQDQLKVWQQVGINRLSIGVQSLNDQALARLGRYQKASDVYKLLSWVEGKFPLLSVDIIIGLPGVTVEEWKKMIHEIVAWPIVHVSMYFLAVHETTPLFRRLQQNELRLPPEDPIVDLYYWTVQTFEKHGIMQYEVSSFARKGCESKHNQVYWDRKPYKGFGVGACSFDGKDRTQTLKNMDRYMRAVERGHSVTAFTETLEHEQIVLEKVMLGLRRVKGLDLKDLYNTMSLEEQERFKEKMSEFEQKDIVTQNGDRLFLNKKMFSVENEVAVKLLEK